MVPRRRSRSCGPPHGRAHVLGIGHRRVAPVARAVHATGERERVAFAGWDDVLAVYANRRRAWEALAPGLLVVRDLYTRDLGVDALLAQDALELGERLRVGGTAVPPQELNRHGPPRARSSRPPTRSPARRCPCLAGSPPGS